MKRFHKVLEKTAHRILRTGLLLTLLTLLYTCLYICRFAPDGGVMNGFLQTVGLLLQHAIATLGLLFAACAIPEVKLL